MGLDAGHVHGQRRFVAQRRVEARQRAMRVLDQIDDFRAGRTAVLAHPVEQVLDLPAEFAQGLGADQAAAALEGVEHAPHRLHAGQIVGRFAPGRQQVFEVADLFLEFLQEDLAHLVVDVVDGLETALRRRGTAEEGRRRGRQRFQHRGVEQSAGYAFGDIGRLGGRGVVGLGLERRGVLGGAVFGVQRLLGRVDPLRLGVGQAPVGRDRLLGVRLGGSGRRLLVGGGRDRRGRVRRRWRFGLRLAADHVRQRPVTQRFQALARDVEDVVAVRTLLAQRFEVVLQAGQGIGQGVELLAAGHAAAADQFNFGVALDPGQVIGGQRQLDHAQRAGHFVEHARHFGEFVVVPLGLDEGDEGLAGVAEVGDRLARDHIEHLARLAGEQVLFGLVVGQAQARDLIVERGVHVQQRAGHVEQGALVGGAAALGDVVHRVALLQHHGAGHAQAHHAEGVADPGERLDLRAQFAGIGLIGAQVQVERVLDPQQVFLDRRGHGVEQGAVAAAEAAAGVFEFGLAGQVRGEFEGLAQVVQRRMPAVAVGDVVQQLAGRFGRGFAARRAEAVVGQHLPGFALDSAERLAQRPGRGQGAVAQRMGHRRGDPEHAPHRFEHHVGEQAVDRRGQLVRVGRRAVFRPGGQCVAQRGQVRRAGVAAGGAADRQRRRQVRRQRPVEVGREQHAFAEPGLAAGGAQFVEQRQQHDRNVAVAALQAFQVIGQQHHAAHQRRAGFVAVGHRALLQGLGQPFHFLGDHRRGVQLDHAQGAVHLVQVAGAHAHARGVGGIFGERLDLLPGLAQGFVQLGLDPAQRGGVDRFAQRGHGALRASTRSRRERVPWPGQRCVGSFILGTTLL